MREEMLAPKCRDGYYLKNEEEGLDILIKDGLEQKFTRIS